MLPEAVEAGDGRFAGRQRVALHLHVEKELRDDADERAPQQHEPDLRGDERPQHELSGRQADASSHDSRADEPPVVARRLGHLANFAPRKTIFAGACRRYDAASMRSCHRASWPARSLPGSRRCSDRRGRCGVQRRDDPIDIVDAPGPGAAARPLQRRPEAGVVGQPLVGREPRMRRPAAKQRARTPPASSGTPSRAHQVDACRSACSDRSRSR